MGEIQRAFASGEVSPTLYGRPDVDRWSSALKTCSNWIVEPEGGLTVRQGFELVGRIPYSSASGIRCVPFEFGPSDSHVQVFHDGYMNLLANGALEYGDIMRLATINKAVTPWQVSYTTENYANGGVTTGTHSYETGDTVKFYGGVLNGLSKVITKVSANVYTLNGTVATAGTETAYARRTTLATGSAPLVEYFIGSYGYDSVRYVQSGDVQYFTNGSYNPLILTRNYHAGVSRALDFSFDNVVGMPTVANTASMAVTASAGTDQLRYKITFTDKNGIESTVMRIADSSTLITGTSTLSVTAVGHGLITNDSIYILASFADDYGNIIYKAGDVVRVAITSVDIFKIPGNGNTATGTLDFAKISASVAGLSPTTAAAATITWGAVAGAVTYNVYKEYGRVYGYIGSTSDVTFVDKGIIPDTKDTPVVGISPFRGSYPETGESPYAVGLFQQRLMFGGFTNDIERIVGSYVGDYTSYDPGASDSSGIDFVLAGKTVSGIEHMVEIAGRAIVLSNTSEWVLKGGTGGGLTPTAINARADSYYGSSSVSPQAIGSSLIYVQRGNRIIRDAKYDYSQEALASNDLTLWSKHLFKPLIKRIAYQRSSQLLWVLLEDGTLAALTYVPEQNIWGWHRHNIDGRAISDICCVSEDGQDRLYALVLHDGSIDVARLPLRWESGDVNDHIGFDMALTYNGFYSGTTGTLTGGTLWTTAETLTLTASASTFVVGDVGKDFLLKKGDEDVQVTCTAYTSGTVISVQPRTIVPTAIRGVACSTWAACASTFSGLAHLEGETVGVIADGGREPDSVVASGAITLSRPFSRVQVGLPITADIKTLDLEATNKDTSLGDFKHVTRVILRILNSRGLKAGLTEDTLEEMATEYTDVVNAAPALQSGVREVLMSATHEDSGSIVVRQDQGLPATILNARTVFNVGDTR